MKISCTVNHNHVNIEVDPEDTLNVVIRNDLHLKGTKINCQKGLCGHCSVIMNGQLVQSCQVPASDAANATILTIEGIGTPHAMHPLQQAFIDYGAVQCGYCVPAFIMAAFALLKQEPSPSHDEIVAAITPILCRCTGYHQIIEAIEAVVRGEYNV